VSSSCAPALVNTRPTAGVVWSARANISAAAVQRGSSADRSTTSSMTLGLLSSRPGREADTRAVSAVRALIVVCCSVSERRGFDADLTGLGVAGRHSPPGVALLQWPGRNHRPEADQPWRRRARRRGHLGERLPCRQGDRQVPGASRGESARDTAGQSKRRRAAWASRVAPDRVIPCLRPGSSLLAIAGDRSATTGSTSFFSIRSNRSS